MNTAGKTILKSPQFHWLLGATISSGLLLSIFDKKKEKSYCLLKNAKCDDKNIRENSVLLSKKCWSHQKLNDAIKNSRDLLTRIKDETSSPGIVVSVSVDGDTVWSEGIGYSDVENRVACSPETVMRIASISKPLAMVAVARLVEEGKLDLDKPVQHYLPDYPQKTWKGEQVTITTRQLVSHLGGIRHYDKKYMKDETKDGDDKDKKEEMKETERAANKNNAKVKRGGDSVHKEFFNKNGCATVKKALEIFKDDPLIKKPGSEYYYTTHGWTLISAVVEAASGKEFIKYMSSIFSDLGLATTRPEYHKSLVYHRARQYVLNSSGRLENSAYVDNSCKWAGGGFISNAPDLVKFGNAMLYSYQYNTGHQGSQLLPGYLKPETVKDVWTPVKNTKCLWENSGQYGMGWCVVDFHQRYGSCRPSKNVMSHTGGAIGGSSVLIVMPSGDIAEGNGDMSTVPLPHGVVVAILVNMESVSLYKTAVEIGSNFKELCHEHIEK